MANIAKIAVEKHENSEQILYNLDKNLSLCDIVRDVCRKSGLPESPVYGLKIIRTRDDPYINTYLSETTYKNIQHNDCLKVVFSIDYILNKRILPHIHEKEQSPEKDIAFESLLKLAIDPVFIDELVKGRHHKNIINTYINTERKNGELLALLVTICHLLQKGYINNTKQDIVTRTIAVLKNSANTTDHLKYALSILHKILVQKDSMFLPWKQSIIREVPITELTPYIWSNDGRSLQYGILLLINTIIKLCKGDQKLQLIKEMNLKQNRDSIYKHIISRNDLDRNTEHELYVLQTYLLSMYKEALNSELNLNDNNIVKKEEFELCDDDVRRLTILMEFDENDSSYTNRTTSYENILINNKSERISLASILSDKSITGTDSVSRKSSRQTSVSIDFENITINYLTLEALRHYKKNHYKTFYQSQVEEKVYEPGIFVTSEKVVKMLAKILHIGRDQPDPKSVFYQPIVFNCTTKTPFFLELFSRSMWLLSRTRREMKVSTIEDYPKVMNVLQKQIKMVLEKRPIDFKALTSDMTETNFEIVLNQWQKEKEEEMNQTLMNNPCILELKKMYTKENEIYLREHRLNILKEGAYFPKISEKINKTSGNVYVRLTKNERDLLIYDVTDVKSRAKELKENIKIAEITHVAAGKNCQHYHLCKAPLFAFSIIINHSQSQVNFIANDERSACYWIDGFNLLAGFPRRSDYYTKDLEELIDMDVRLKIIDLQNITIPRNAPVVPPVPTEVKPPVPPKSEALIKHMRKQIKL